MPSTFINIGYVSELAPIECLFSWGVVNFLPKMYGDRLAELGTISFFYGRQIEIYEQRKYGICNIKE